MSGEPLKSADTKLDCVLMASLKVADHGKTVAVEDRMEVEVVFRHFGFFQSREPALQIFFALGQIARLLIPRIQHGKHIEKISAHRRSFFGQLHGGGLPPFYSCGRNPQAQFLTFVFLYSTAIATCTFYPPS